MKNSRRELESVTKKTILNYVIEPYLKIVLPWGIKSLLLAFADYKEIRLLMYLFEKHIALPLKFIFYIFPFENLFEHRLLSMFTCF